MHAASTCNKNIIGYLLEQGSDINIQDAVSKAIVPVYMNYTVVTR
jgi:hypothetical protein